jgi:putative membrane protein
VIADKGINEKVKPEAWQEVADLVAEGFGRREHAAAICRAVARCGEILREHFPARPDDTNELPNLGNDR